MPPSVKRILVSEISTLTSPCSASSSFWTSPTVFFGMMMPGMPGIIIPKKTVGEVQKLLDAEHGEVNVEISDTKIRFTLGGIVLLSKLIEGTFPDYDRVTPKNNDKAMNVDRSAF